MSVSITIELDTRRMKKNGKFPVKLLVTYKRIPKRYPTIFELGEEEFKSLSAKRLSENSKKVRDALAEIVNKAQTICKALVPFEQSEFEKKIHFQQSLFPPKIVNQATRNKLIQ